MEPGVVQIQILGTSFSIRADEDPEYVKKLIQYVQKKVKEIEESIPVKDPLRIAILSSMLITDELFKEKNKRSGDIHAEQQNEQEVLRITREMIERLDKTLRE